MIEIVLGDLWEEVAEQSDTLAERFGVDIDTVQDFHMFIMEGAAERVALAGEATSLVRTFDRLGREILSVPTTK